MSANLKLPRTIRLDPSDTFIFEHAANANEWAVPGSFLFLDGDPSQLQGKARHAFRSGFLGVESLGFSTLCVVTPVSAAEYENLQQQWARRFTERFGAPDLATALAAAREELAFAASICDHPEGTLLAVQRSWDSVTGLREQFRTLKPREAQEGQDRLHAFARAFTFHEVDGNEAGDEAGLGQTNDPADHVDLAGMIKPERI